MILTFEQIEKIIQDKESYSKKDEYHIFVAPGKLMTIKEFDNIIFDEHNNHHTDSLNRFAQ